MVIKDSIIPIIYRFCIVFKLLCCFSFWTAFSPESDSDFLLEISLLVQCLLVEKNTQNLKLKKERCGIKHNTKSIDDRDYRIFNYHSA
jgi:hypothetical protein